MTIPTLVVYYEDFEGEHGAEKKLISSPITSTMKELLNFLELEDRVVTDPPQFASGKNYIEYFTPKEQELAMKLLEEVATLEFWELMKRYY